MVALAMTGDRNCLTSLKPNSSKVTFRDGAIENIIRKGKFNEQGLPFLKDVMLVEGLTTNLISISQLCDQGLQVSFTKEQLIVTDNVSTLVTRGTRSSDNCYF